MDSYQLADVLIKLVMIAISSWMFKKGWKLKNGPQQDFSKPIEVQRRSGSTFMFLGGVLLLTQVVSLSEVFL